MKSNLKVIIMENKTKELEYLLNNYWCIKEKNPELYYNIKNNIDYYKNFIQTKLGSKLIVNDRFIKLEKIPANPKNYMGIIDYTSTLEYVIMMIILIFLEDKPKREQFILSDLIDFITNTATTMQLNNVPNWNILHHRKCLVKVINHLEDLGIIKIVEETTSFTEDIKAEGLYETTGISNYYVREFKNNIQNYTSLKDFASDEFNEQNENLGDIRRYKIYRNLLYAMATYTDELSESEIDYLRKFRGTIQSEIEKYTTSNMELTKSMAILLFEPKGKKDNFPNTKAISDIILLVNNKIVTLIEKKQLNLEKNEIINISKEQLSRIIKEVRQENKEYFSKAYRELGTDAFVKEVINCMMEYDFLKQEYQSYKIYPSVSKLVGYINKEEKKQLNLFGGNEYE